MDDMDGMDEILEEFLVEAYENVDNLDRELVDLEKDPESGDLLASIFRNLHTLKGTSGFLALPHLESLAHAAENLLSELREGRLAVRTEIMDALLAAVDGIKTLLDTIEATGADGDDDHCDLVSRLHGLAEVGDIPAPADENPPAAPKEANSEELNSAEPEADPTAEPASDMTEVEPTAPTSSRHATDTSIRVDVGLLDRLMNLVGELVLARNRILQYETTAVDSSFHSTSQQLDLITTELQEGVMKTRMQPISGVWSKLPRVVRDLSASCDKQVRVEMVGADTELDKTLIEAIKDPLTHIVRNAVDHGIETPAERTAAGKDETGTLTLRAFHEGGQVIIEISDDGAGLDLDRIRQKAVANDLLSTERAAQLTDRDAAMLIFQPGFSTAATVTSVSGRGVGMDVVKTNVEKIGGTLDVQSQPGEGMTLTLKIPLTLAIIPALIIGCDQDRFLIPQINLVEVLHIDDSSSGAQVEMAAGAEVLRLRGKLLPIVSLRRVLGLAEAATDAAGHNIVVLQADGAQFGLAVDNINDTEEIVVKPLSPHLKLLGAYAGTTIMGDGAVSLILDVMGLARLGGVGVAAQPAEFGVDVTDDTDRRSSTQMVLVCTVEQQRIGVPLGFVSRLEVLSRSSVERAGGQDVIQYRGRLLHLIHVADALGVDSTESEDETIQVLVHEAESGLYGFVVDQIIDVLEADLRKGEPSAQRGLTMSGVIGRRVTDLLDIDELVAGRRLALSPAGNAAA